MTRLPAGHEADVRRRPRRLVERPVEMILHHEGGRLARLVGLLEMQEHRSPLVRRQCRSVTSIRRIGSACD